MTDRNAMYDKIYDIIGEKTPLKKHDCGQLCGAVCCTGGDNDGMLLFPGESTELPTRAAELGELAVCSGKCDRSKRPLSCRIFPFFPAVDEKGRVSVVIDARARRLCPLAAYSDNVIFDRSFISAVKHAGKLLAKDDDCRAFMREVTLDIEAIERFYEN